MTPASTRILPIRARYAGMLFTTCLAGLVRAAGKGTLDQLKVTRFGGEIIVRRQPVFG